RGEIAVVRQDEQALRVVIEAADGVDVLAYALQKIDDRRALLRIRPRRHVPARLVEQQIHVTLGDLDAPAVDADVVAGRVGLRAQLANRFAVDAHAALEHQLLAGAARRDPGLRENLLKPFHLVRPVYHEVTKSTKSLMS